MWRHQADEPDRAGHRGRRAHRQADPQHRQQPGPVEVHAEAERLGLAQRQRIDRPAQGREQGQADQDERRGQGDVIPALLRQRSQHPQPRLIGRVGAGGEVQRQGEERAHQAGDRRARQDQGQGPASAEGKGQRAGRHGSGQAQQRGRQRKRRGQAKIDRDHRAQRRPAGHAQQAGLGQRVAQQALQHSAGQPQRRAHQDRQDGAGQPQLGQHQARQAEVAREQARDQVRRADVHPPDEQRPHRRHQQGQGRQAGQDKGRKGARGLHGVGLRVGSRSRASRRSRAASADCGRPQVAATSL